MTASRRLAAAALLAAVCPLCAQGLGASADIGARPAGEPAHAADTPEHRRLLDQGEHLLAAGDPQAAEAAFDRAATIAHSPDTEAALVRCYMQAGDYRRALAFGAHAAVAHLREWPAGMALYAWLLQAGGQNVAARRMLDRAIALAPDDALLAAASTELAGAWPRARGALRQPPLAIAPYAVGTAAPDSAEVVGTAVLVDAGRAALAPASLLGPAVAPGDAVWLRNGLGQTAAAAVESIDAALGLVLLRLATPLPAGGVEPAHREPFGGSPGTLVEYAVDPEGTSAWPLLRLGFFARATTSPGPRLLGIDAPAGPRGGPVFDAAGRLAGVAVSSPDGADRLVSARVISERLGTLQPAAPAHPGVAAGEARHADLDQVYERSLRVALQLLRIR